MNVFVLCTGRCGSTTFHRACEHIENYTAGHETRKLLIGRERFEYPTRHIEVDNRLSWLLGRLNQRYGDSAYYLHLTRDETDTADSFNRRWSGTHSIIRAYAEGILSSRDRNAAICIDYCRTVNANIRAFLQSKSRVMEFRLEEASRHFPAFWRAIGAEGDLSAALAEFERSYNQSERRASHPLRDLVHKLRAGLRARLR